MPSAQIGNGFDATITTQFVKDIERLAAEIDVYKAEHMARCKRQRELINATYDRARDAGLPTKELKAVVKARALEARAKALRGQMEPDAQDTIDMIRHALGDLADLPLGAAAMERAGKPEDREMLDDLLGDDDGDQDDDPRDSEWARGTAGNA